MSISRIFAFACTAFLICGCTRTVQHRVADYYPGTVPTTQPVPRTAVYSIRFLDEKGKKTGGIPNSHHLVHAGERVGFDVDEDKGLVAIAGNNQFPIAIPVGYGAVWSATYRKPTQFSKEVAKAAVVTGKAAAVGAGLFVRGLLELDGADDDDEPCIPVARRPVPR